MEKVLYCTSLLNVIKDFAGLLSEYPLYYITRAYPRTWGFLWWSFGWVVPSQRHLSYSLVVSPRDIRPQINTFQFPANILDGWKFCEYDDHFVAFPYGARQGRTCVKLEIDFTRAKEFKTHPLPVSIAFALIHPKLDPSRDFETYFQIFKILTYSEDFNINLAYWYSENLIFIRNEKANQYLGKIFLPYPHDMRHLTEKQLLWVDATCPQDYWLKYHFNHLTYLQWKAIEDPWDFLYKLMRCQLYPTVLKFLKEFALQFNYLSDQIKWNENLNKVKDVKFIMDHIPLDTKNISFDLSDVHEQIFEAFIGKIGSGLFSWFSMRQTKKFLNVSQILHNLLYRAWMYFTPIEKTNFLKDFCTGLIKENVTSQYYEEKSYLYQKANTCSLFDFFRNLLKNDLFPENIFKHENPIRHEMLQKFLSYSRQDNLKKALLYLHVFIYSNRFA